MNLKDLIKKHENSGQKEFPKVSWLSLKNDGDSVLVRILHKDSEDFDVYETHEVEIDGYKTKVKCNGEGCPLCAALGNPKLRMFLQMIDLSDGSHKIWERGVQDIKALLSEIEENGNLNRRQYKIKRNGVKGSTKTTYQYYAKDLMQGEAPNRVKVLGFYVRELSNEQMVQALEGSFSFKALKEQKPSNNVETGVKHIDDYDMPVEVIDMPF